jgi:hypothetical protein
LGEAGGINLYDYVYNSPFSFFDADGLIGTPAENIALVLALGEEEAAEILGPAAARAAANAIAAPHCRGSAQREFLQANPDDLLSPGRSDPHSKTLRCADAFFLLQKPQ